MKYDDVLYYKNLLRKDYDIISFVYVRISKELYKILHKELNIEHKQEQQNEYKFKYKHQFTYDMMIYLSDDFFKGTDSLFYVIIAVNNKYKPNKFASFDIDILSENERIIKRLLE